MAGFEPATTCTPSRCATRLRYIPAGSAALSITPVEQGQDFAQLLAHLFDDLARGVVRRARALSRQRLRRGAAPRELGLEPLLGPRDREALVVEKLLNAEHGLDVPAAIDALPGAVLRRRQGAELRLPVAQDIRLGIGDLADLPNLEEQLVGDRFVHGDRLDSTRGRPARTAWRGGRRRNCGA